MPNDMEPIAATAAFADVLEQLQSLTRDFLLGFRLEVGKLMIERFFGGSIHNYRSQDPGKEASFAKFAQACADDLANLGLSPAVLRQCINARATYDALPQTVRERLLFSQVVELARVADATQRARLAMDATALNWTVGELKDAVRRANDGSYYDTEPLTPGTQPPPEDKAPQGKGRKPGRVLVQFERAVKDIEALRVDWMAVDASGMRPAHKERAKAVVLALKTQVVALEKALAEPK